MVGPAVDDGPDVIDLRGRPAAHPAAVGVEGEDLRSDPAPVLVEPLRDRQVDHWTQTAHEVGNLMPVDGVFSGMQTARCGTVCLCAFVLITMPAGAKEGVRAKLEGSVRLAAAPGTTIPITWRLVDARGSAFGASGIYLRISRCGGGLRRVKARNRGGGRFSARVRVPAGGIRRLRVGLEGWRIPAGGKAQRADMLFEFDPPLVRRCPRG